MIHDQGFVFSTDKNQLFIQSAQLRSKIATLSHTLEYRIHQQFSCGEDSAKLQDIYRFLKIAEHINEQTRLMYFTSTPLLKQSCPQWLEHIHHADQQISQYLAQVSVNNVHHLALPNVDFEALRRYQVPAEAQQEAIAAQSFINKLDIIYLSLCELKNQSTTITNPTIVKPIVLTWKWRDIISKLTSQMTLKIKLLSSCTSWNIKSHYWPDRCSSLGSRFWFLDVNDKFAYPSSKFINDMDTIITALNWYYLRFNCSKRIITFPSGK